MQPPTTMEELRRELEFDPDVASLDLPSSQEEEQHIKDLSMGTTLSRPSPAAVVKEDLKIGSAPSTLSPVATVYVAGPDPPSTRSPKLATTSHSPEVNEAEPSSTSARFMNGASEPVAREKEDLDTPLARFLNDRAEAVDPVPVESVASDPVGSEPVTTRSSPLPANTPTKPRSMYFSPTSPRMPSRFPTGRNDHSSTHVHRERSTSPSPAAKRRATITGRSGRQYPPVVSPRRRSRGGDIYRPASGSNSRSASPVRELFPLRVPRSREREPALSSRYETPIKIQSRSSTVSPEKKTDREKENSRTDDGKKKYPSLKSVAIPGMGEHDKLVCYNCAQKGHWFMDCKVACGRCGGDGHRTIDCDYLGKGKTPKVEDPDEQ
ncbi:uncharacterized protein PAC_17216 [Phialocephala subalpina]|uniref:CCHC-type domain-containing protein n=1 Tax=Phialocephala subalpina TaxID=576137 RepID=A0A1L7XQW0_9HELO|nr:uncharacterized protein PAC_17216 [Phialocephala subalpina]